MTAQDEVQAVGPLGPGLFVLAVAAAELIPLFPTQPLALTAGLLFGTFKARFWCYTRDDAQRSAPTHSASPGAAHDLVNFTCPGSTLLAVMRWHIQHAPALCRIGVT